MKKGVMEDNRGYETGTSGFQNKGFMKKGMVTEDQPGLSDRDVRIVSVGFYEKGVREDLPGL